MIRKQIYIPEDLDRDLMLLANLEGVNYSKLIREGAEEIIRKKRSKKIKEWGKGVVGSIRLKEKTDSVEVVRDYYNNFGK